MKGLKISASVQILSHKLGHAYGYAVNAIEHKNRQNDVSTMNGSPYFRNAEEKRVNEISQKIEINLKNVYQCDYQEKPYPIPGNYDRSDVQYNKTKVMKIFLGGFFISTGLFINIKNIFLKEDRRIKVIKFMYINKYLRDYGEKMFWDNAEEKHAFMYTSAFDIKSVVQKLPSENSKAFKDYTYCFLQLKGNKYDTIYSDSSLKDWIIKKNGNKSEFLRSIQIRIITIFKF